MYGASIGTDRRRLGGASTAYPSLCSAEATAFQLEASAQAPWTRTIVGLVIATTLCEQGAQPCDGLVDLLGADDQGRQEAQRGGAGRVDDQFLVDQRPARDLGRGAVDLRGDHQ